jgi:hypothetical protein
MSGGMAPDLDAWQLRCAATSRPWVNCCCCTGPQPHMHRLLASFLANTYCVVTSNNFASALQPGISTVACLGQQHSFDISAVVLKLTLRDRLVKSAVHLIVCVVIEVCTRQVWQSTALPRQQCELSARTDPLVVTRSHKQGQQHSFALHCHLSCLISLATMCLHLLC